MKRGEWSRWGRGKCEGYSLEIGEALRGAVVRSSTLDLPTVWLASLNTTALGEYLERDVAMRRVEEHIESTMNLVLYDWELFKAAKARR
jgi:hypothetical protein